MNNWALITFVLTTHLLSCDNKDEKVREKFKTLDSFRCPPIVNPYQYKIDSIFLVKKVSELIESREDPYNASAYNTNTIVQIDTILYDSQRKYAAVFVVLKVYEPNTNVWVYDGLVHFAESDSIGSDSVNWQIYSYHGAIHINSETYNEMSEILRFHNLVGRSYHGHLNKQEEFNLDDCRFWNSSYFNDTIQVSRFD
jgi:hypothetical protein